jgi:hypothetical protein
MHCAGFLAGGSTSPQPATPAATAAAAAAAPWLPHADASDLRRQLSALSAVTAGRRQLLLLQQQQEAGAEQGVLLQRLRRVRHVLQEAYGCSTQHTTPASRSLRAVCAPEQAAALDGVPAGCWSCSTEAAVHHALQLHHFSGSLQRMRARVCGLTDQLQALHTGLLHTSAGSSNAVGDRCCASGGVLLADAGPDCCYTSLEDTLRRIRQHRASMRR